MSDHVRNKMGSTREGTATGLVGRDHECEVVDGLLDGALQGNSGALVLRGEAGTGKSSLLQYAAERADEVTVLRVTGVQGESDLDFAGLHSLVRPIVGYLAKLPEPQRDAVEGALGLAPSRGADRFLVSAGVLSLLAAAAEECPLLCLVDDAQWLDVPSAASLVFTARRLGAEGLVIMFAAREGERRQFDAPASRSWSSAGSTANRRRCCSAGPRPTRRRGFASGFWPRPRVTPWRCSSFRRRFRTGSLPVASCFPTRCR